MELNARIDVNFVKVNVNISNGHFDLILIQIIFIFISFNIKVLLVFHTKCQPNTPSHFGTNADFIGFASFSIGGHLEFSARLNSTIRKHWSLIMLHMKFEINACSG